MRLVDEPLRALGVRDLIARCSGYGLFQGKSPCSRVIRLGAIPEGEEEALRPPPTLRLLLSRSYRLGSPRQWERTSSHLPSRKRR